MKLNFPDVKLSEVPETVTKSSQRLSAASAAATAAAARQFFVRWTSVARETRQSLPTNAFVRLLRHHWQTVHQNRWLAQFQCSNLLQNIQSLESEQDLQYPWVAEKNVSSTWQGVK